MSQSIDKAASQFISKDLKGNADFKTVSAYLQSVGYAVVLYSRSSDNELLVKYGLLEFSKTVKGFTVHRKDFKAVFIDDSSPCGEKLCVLLHETAHIVLGHIHKKDLKDGRLMEMEADAFAHAVLFPKASNLPKVIALCLAFIISTAGVCLLAKEKASTTTVATENTTQSEVAAVDSSEAQAQTVYVTPFGAKFHRPDCRYVKNKDCKSYSRTQALKKYEPCSVCDP